MHSQEWELKLSYQLLGVVFGQLHHIAGFLEHDVMLAIEELGDYNTNFDLSFN